MANRDPGAFSFGPSFRPQNRANQEEKSLLATVFAGKTSKDVQMRLKRQDTHVFHGVSASNKAVEQLYELGDCIGKGAFGVVREARDKATGVMFCCKSIPRENLTDEMFADIQMEAEVMMHLRGHPHVVEIMGLFQDDTHIHIVEEMCTGGDLYSKLTAGDALISERELASLARQVLTVLQHCHAMGVIYRDCKPDNFLLSSTGPDGVIKATDFGISKFLKPGDSLDEFCGTPTYMAPEVFDMSYGYPVDVWAAGIMLYWMLSRGDFPFKGRNKIDLARRVCADNPLMEGPSWDGVTPEAKDLITRMLTKDASKRPKPAECLQHKWFKKMSVSKSKVKVVSSQPGQVAPQGNIMLQRMKAFAGMPAFKQEVMRSIAEHLDEAYLVGLRPLFDAWDEDETGGLNQEQVARALDKQGFKMDALEVKRIMQGVDVNKNGQIDFLEFVSATINTSLLERKDLLQEAFDRYDLDKDGVISRSELETVLRSARITPERVAKILAEIDNHTDGQVDFAGFRNLMLETRAGSAALPVWGGMRTSSFARSPASLTVPGAPQFVAFGGSYRPQNQPSRLDRALSQMSQKNGSQGKDGSSQGGRSPVSTSMLVGLGSGDASLYSGTSPAASSGYTTMYTGEYISTNTSGGNTTVSTQVSGYRGGHGTPGSSRHGAGRGGSIEMCLSPQHSDAALSLLDSGFSGSPRASAPQASPAVGHVHIESGAGSPRVSGDGRDHSGRPSSPSPKGMKRIASKGKQLAQAFKGLLPTRLSQSGQPDQPDQP